MRFSPSVTVPRVLDCGVHRNVVLRRSVGVMRSLAPQRGFVSSCRRIVVCSLTRSVRGVLVRGVVHVGGNGPVSAHGLGSRVAYYTRSAVLLIVCPGAAVPYDVDVACFPAAVQATVVCGRWLGIAVGLFRGAVCAIFRDVLELVCEGGC